MKKTENNVFAKRIFYFDGHGYFKIDVLIKNVYSAMDSLISYQL